MLAQLTLLDSQAADVETMLKGLSLLPKGLHEGPCITCLPIVCWMRLGSLSRACMTHPRCHPSPLQPAAGA